MNAKTKVAVAAFALFVLVAAACNARPESDRSKSVSAVVRVGDEGPAFTLPSAQGGTVSLSDYRGRKSVLLYFSMGPG